MHRTVLTRPETRYSAPARGVAPELVVFHVALRKVTNYNSTATLEGRGELYRTPLGVLQDTASQQPILGPVKSVCTRSGGFSVQVWVTTPSVTR